MTNIFGWVVQPASYASKFLAHPAFQKNDQFDNLTKCHQTFQVPKMEESVRNTLYVRCMDTAYGYGKNPAPKLARVLPGPRKPGTASTQQGDMLMIILMIIIMTGIIYYYYHYED